MSTLYNSLGEKRSVEIELYTASNYNEPSDWQLSEFTAEPEVLSMETNCYIYSIVKRVAIEGKCGVGIFSLRKYTPELMLHLNAAEIGLSESDIMMGKLSAEQLEQFSDGTSPLNTAPIYIDDSRMLKMTDLRDKMQAMKSKYDIKLFVIEGVGLIEELWDYDYSIEEAKRRIELKNNTLKELAKELNTSIITLG